MTGTQKVQEKGDTIYNSPPGLFPFPPVMGTKTINIVIRAKTIDLYLCINIGFLILLLLIFLFTEQIPVNNVNQVVIP